MQFTPKKTAQGIPCSWKATAEESVPSRSAFHSSGHSCGPKEKGCILRCQQNLASSHVLPVLKSREMNGWGGHWGQLRPGTVWHGGRPCAKRPQWNPSSQAHGVPFEECCRSQGSGVWAAYAFGSRPTSLQASDAGQRAAGFLVMPNSFFLKQECLFWTVLCWKNTTYFWFYRNSDSKIPDLKYWKI